MMIQKTLSLSALCAVALCCSAAQAGAIYPIDRATILAGSKFDLKVEFDAASEQKDIRATLNGVPLSQGVGRDPEFIGKENGNAGSSLQLRDVVLDKPGRYKLAATDGKQAMEVEWEVFGTGPRRARNVILFIGDGMTIANRTAARVLSRGITEGKYRGMLSFDDMPSTALIGTSGVDSLITDSANAMSAYTTGHKSSVNALGVYASRAANNMAHPKVETITELVKRKTKMGVGIVSDAELQDATPAGMVAHTRRRADKEYIAEQLFMSRADVVLGGGMAWFQPQGVKGSKRKDDNDIVALFRGDGYAVAQDKQGLAAAAGKPGTRKLFGAFHPDNMDGSLDRLFLKKGTVEKYPNQPDLTEMTKAAIDVLSRNPDGFVLMVEAALIDKFNHPLDWERAAFDTIMLSNAVQVAKDFAAKRNDTLIIVVPDHTHSGSVAGVIDDARKGPELREKVGTYAEAGYPNYPAPNAAGYPEKIDVSRRMAFFYGAYPDHYETMRPKMDGPFEPVVKNDKGQYIANPKYKQQFEDAAHVDGPLPHSADSGVHTADDAVLNAMGPGSDKFRGFMDNTEVFRRMVEALGLGGAGAVKGK
jgi:alkaline phosphatase